MFALDNPAVTDGLPAWQAWSESLNALAQQHPEDRTIADAQAHSARMIRLLTEYPQGLSAQDPRFRAAVRDAMTDR